MLLLETKEQLTLNELLRIAYEYGNNNADMPTDSKAVEHEFREWINSSKHLFKKLTLPVVIYAVCETCLHYPRNLMDRTCSECDDGDNWEAN